jgi:hypothetical protein
MVNGCESATPRSVAALIRSPVFTILKVSTKFVGIFLQLECTERKQLILDISIIRIFVLGGLWEVLMCQACGSRGIHVKCANLEVISWHSWHSRQVRKLRGNFKFRGIHVKCANLEVISRY